MGNSTICVLVFKKKRGGGSKLVSIKLKIPRIKKRQFFTKGTPFSQNTTCLVDAQHYGLG